MSKVNLFCAQQLLTRLNQNHDIAKFFGNDPVRYLQTLGFNHAILMPTLLRFIKERYSEDLFLQVLIEFSKTEKSCAELLLSQIDILKHVTQPSQLYNLFHEMGKAHAALIPSLIKLVEKHKENGIPFPQNEISKLIHVLQAQQRLSAHQLSAPEGTEKSGVDKKNP